MSKKLYLLTAVMMAALSSFSQVPQGIPYQAIARDNSGNPLLNQTVSFRFSVHDQSAGGTVVYSETHSTATNEFGLVNLVIGAGNVSAGTFESIDWGGGSKFVQVELDPAGGASFTDMGTTQMLSVPYALNAGNGNWELNGNNISNANSGNVGIGTTNPQAKLDVNGNINISGDLYLNNTLVLEDNGSGRTQFYHADNGVEHLEFNGYNTWFTNRNVFVDQNLGVGLNPGIEGIDARLHVKGNLKLDDGTQGIGKVLKSDANGLASWGNLSGTDILSTPIAPKLSCPVVTGSVFLSVAVDIEVSGNFAYVSSQDNGDEGMYVVDITNPGSPNIVGSLGTPPGVYPTQLGVSGNYAYLGMTNGTMSVVDITDPTSPSVVGSVVTGSVLVGLAISGNYAYVLAAQPNSTIQVIDISNPFSPVVVGSVPLGYISYLASLAVSGNYAYATYGNVMFVIDISNPFSPLIVGSVPIGADTRSIAVSGNYAYTANTGATTVEIIDISIPESPTVVNSILYGYDEGYGYSSIAVSDNYACVVRNESGAGAMLVIDITNPLSVSVVGMVELSSPWVLTVSGNYAFVASYDDAYMWVINLACSEDYSLTVNPETGQTTAIAQQWNTSGNDLSNSNTGNVGIGTTTPTQKLHVVGNGLFSGTVTASCGTLTCSDQRYKTQITPLGNALENVEQLQGVSYFFNQQDFPEMNFNDRLQIGLIAQEVELIYPELVNTDENGYKSVDYSKLTPILVEAVKELKAQNEALTNQNEVLTKNDTVTGQKLAELEMKVNALLGAISTAKN